MEEVDLRKQRRVEEREAGVADSMLKIQSVLRIRRIHADKLL